MDLTNGLAEAIAALPQEFQPFLTEILGAMSTLEAKVAALAEEMEESVARNLSQILSTLSSERVTLVEGMHGLLDRVDIKIQVLPRPVEGVPARD
jgi:predicted component of type VI protein secretion system